MIKSYRARQKIANAAIYTILTILVVLWVLPIVWLVICSLREEPGAYTTYIWPKSFTFDNYIRRPVCGVRSGYTRPSIQKFPSCISSFQSPP